MKKYIVGIREVHVNYVEVLAENPSQALIIASNKGLFIDDALINLEYSHDLDRSTWTVEECKD